MWRGFSNDSESICNSGNTGDIGSIPGSARSPGKENGYPLQYSCLENSMDRGAWQATTEQPTLSLSHQERAAQNENSRTLQEVPLP